jgi:chaperonin GroES
MKLRPLSDRIIVKKIDLEVKSAGGIILGDIEKEREIVFGKVLFVGPGRRMENGKVAPISITVGDVIAFRESLPTRANYRGEFVWVLREQDIFFVVDDEDVTEKPYQLEGYEFDKAVAKHI